MKRAAVIAMIILSAKTEAQYVRQYLTETKQEVTIYGGIGIQHGLSNRTGHILVSPEGQTLVTGDYKLKLNNHSEIAGLCMTTPVGIFNLGAGIEFERNLLYRVSVESNGQRRTHQFYEGYQSDKVYLTMQYPYNSDGYGKWFLTPSISAGAFWFSMLANNTLYGFVEANAGPFFRLQGSISRRFDFLKISVMAYGDYRHFSNTSLSGSRIKQHFITSGGLIGIIGMF
jgi:hypothetical protein